MALTEDQALAAARAFAEGRDIPWEPEVLIELEASERFGAMVWYVKTNASALGCNFDIYFDEETGEVLDWNWNPE